jgi:hypothetical protein
MIDEPPSFGSLFQLSQVFSKYGYQPIAGLQFSSNSTTVLDSKNRVYYTRPTPDRAINNKVFLFLPFFNVLFVILLLLFVFLLPLFLDPSLLTVSGLPLTLQCMIQSIILHHYLER